MGKYRARNSNRVRPKTHSRPGGYRPQPVVPREKMSARDAIDLADTMDLSDGAYFAVIGDLMGADGDEAYMVGVEACLEEGR